MAAEAEAARQVAAAASARAESIWFDVAGPTWAGVYRFVKSWVVVVEEVV